MRTHLIALLAAAALLGACSKDAEEAPVATTTTAVQDTQPAQVTPTGPAPGSREDFELNVGDRVFFGFDRSDLTPEATATLDRQAAWLQKYPNYAITIEGHADERGTREYNLALGERRAAAVQKYMVALGISPARVQTISYGKERPAVQGSNEAAWAQNRRGVTVLN